MDKPHSPHRLTRVTEIVLVVNAALAAIAALGFFIGLLPLAAEQPAMARRAAAGEFAGALSMLFIATRLRRDASLIALPIAFVFCELVASGYEVYKSGSSGFLPPLVLEAVVLAFYAVYAATVWRARHAR